MRTIFPVIFIICFTSCSVDKKETNATDTYTAIVTSTEPSCDQLLFSLKNIGHKRIKDIEILLPDTTLHFSNLDAQSQSAWTCVKSAYTYAKMKYRDDNDSLYVRQPIDFVGETLYEKGKMTYVVNYDQDNKRFNWTHTTN